MNNSCAFLAEAATAAAVAAASRRCFMPSHDSKEDEGCRIHTSYYCVKGSKERVCKFWQANFLIKSAQASRRHCRPDSCCPAEDIATRSYLRARTRALCRGEMMQFQSSTVSCKNRGKGAAKWLM